MRRIGGYDLFFRDIRKCVDWYVNRSVEINEYVGMLSLFGWIGVYVFAYYFLGGVPENIMKLISLFSMLGLIISLGAYVQVRIRVLGGGDVSYDNIQIVVSNAWASGEGNIRKMCVLFALSRLMNAFFGGMVCVSVFILVGKGGA